MGVSDINPNAINFETELLAEKETNHKSEIIRKQIMEEAESLV